ncbi:MAG: FAD-dependent oxidoreductase [Pseudomonadota bacterium]
MTNTSVIIAGGGLSGCLVAHALTTQGIDYLLIDARNRLGGRILSPVLSDNSPAAVDMGPSWFWPHQRGLISVIQAFGLGDTVYEQSHAGDSVIEYASGQLERRAGAVSMAGSYRLDGGMHALIERIQTTLPADSIRLNTSLTSINTQKQSAIATLQTPHASESVSCQTVVLAMPPRVFADTVDWPAIDDHARHSCKSVATWMATEAKITLIYADAFWLSQGLSGDAMSQIGPLGEVHDATPRGSTQGALFGFVSTRAPHRINNEESLKQMAVEQIQRMFNTTQTPTQILLKDWTTDKLTATDADVAGQRAHPSGAALKPLMPEGVIWAGSETALEDAGYLEGAVHAANAAIQQILQR